MSRPTGSPAEKSDGQPTLVAAAFISAVAAIATVAWLPSITAPDANGWLSWTHEIATGTGIDLHHGPSWKPLPVILSLPTALISTPAAATFWLWLVRSSAILSSLLLWRLARRQGSTLAGFAAALLPLAIPPWINSAIVGDSEPLVMALGLGAVLFHLEGRWRWALALLAVAGLARPELWPFLAGYALLQLKERKRGALVAGSLAALITLAGWFGFPWLVSAAHETQFGMPTGHSLANATLKTVRDNILSVIPPKAWVLIPIGIWAAWRHRNRAALIATGVAGLLIAEIVVLWALPVNVSASGYAPVVRYFAPAGVLLCLVAGAGADGIRTPMAGRLRTFATVALVALVGWSLASALPENQRIIDRYRIVSEASVQAVDAVKAAGGVNRLRPCLPFTISNFSAIGWSITRRLDLPLAATTSAPRTPSVALDYTVGEGFLRATPPAITAGRRVLGRSPDWEVVYWPGNGGCLP